MKTDVLQSKGRNYLISAVLSFFLFTIAFVAIKPSSTEAIRALITSGLFATAFFAFKGIDLLNTNNKKDFEVDIYTCISNESGGHPHKAMFLQPEKNELLIYNTSSNMVFIQGMEYEIYFRKSEFRTSHNVLAISLINAKESDVHKVISKGV